jgi:hypothetical protein
MHHFLNSPYPDGPNVYINRIEANIEEINRRIAARQKGTQKEPATRS